jgi:uroporphyrinogen-III decarboxylase
LNIIPFIDSDGNVEQMIPWLEEVGVAGILPLERRAGVNAQEIRDKHSKWLMIGHFDKTVMSQGEHEIKNEFERLQPLMDKGGFIPSVDHQTPPDVSLEQYKYYVCLLKEFCSLNVS